LTAAPIVRRADGKRRTLSRDEYELYAPVVRRTAMLLARKAPRGIAVNDLCARGWAGLLDALSSAEAMGADDLEGFAAARIRTAMYDYLGSLDARVRDARRESRLLARVIGTLERALGRPPEEAEIARSMELDPDGYDRLLTRIADAGVARLLVLDLDEGSLSGSTPEAEIEAATLVEAIERLPRGCQQVLSLLYQDGCTPNEAASVLGTNEGRVRRVHTEALHRVRAALGKE
jgi:RNA polymerase sigma factor for flagellar operon FliA